jgi:predicted CXXCH cytochrome family protein
MAPVPALAESSCFTANCHRAIATLKLLHQPVKDEDCLACHVRTTIIHPILVGEGKTFRLVADGAKLCDRCHDTLGRKNVVHDPVRQGDCLACHKIHGAEGRFLLDIAENQTPLCLRCHDRRQFDEKYLHGPVAIGACIQCHDPHEAPNRALLKLPSRDLCLKCHADFAKTMTTAIVSHAPVKDRTCTTCHNPHGSPSRHLLGKPVPDLCFSCHEKIAHKARNARSQHRTLHEKGSCNNCHLPHFSPVKGLIAGTEQTLCLGCHGNDQLGTPPLRNMKKETNPKNLLHGPVKSGSCSSCHDPHGSDSSSLVRGAYPASFYAPYTKASYDFCLGCHNKDLLRFAETTLYTGFRNGKRNLHFVHVVDKRKGRTCRACHEPHGGSGEKLISKEGPQFGQWKIPIRFQLSPTGGSCAPGCHRSFRYNREKPEIYSTARKR